MYFADYTISFEWLAIQYILKYSHISRVRKTNTRNLTKPFLAIGANPANKRYMRSYVRVVSLKITWIFNEAACEYRRSKYCTESSFLHDMAEAIDTGCR